MNFKNLIPNALKHKIKVILKRTERDIIIKSVQNNQIKEKEKLKNKSHIIVTFLVIHDSIWKYGELYNLFENHDRYEPIISIIPLVRQNKANMEQYEQTKNHFLNKTYNVFETFDAKTNTWLDIDKIGPDIIFFTNPHKLTFPKYHLDLCKTKLSCYCPYAFVVIGELWMHYGQDFHQYLWKHFVETKSHYKFSKKYNLSKNSNVFISGYPGLDVLYKYNFQASFPWKKIKTETKKIIWAPHHTIEGFDANLGYSNFIEQSEFIFQLLDNYRDLQIVFKPHPILKENLYKLKDWGKEKTDEYYWRWKEHERGQIHESEYVDLFFHSDAMIMDSASFIAEYLYFNKPCYFSVKEPVVLGRFNSFGKQIFNYLYKGDSEKEIISFIENVVLGENDYLKKERNSFFKNSILPNSKKTASTNIFDEINRALC